MFGKIGFRSGCELLNVPAAQVSLVISKKALSDSKNPIQLVACAALQAAMTMESLDFRDWGCLHWTGGEMRARSDSDANKAWHTHQAPANRVCQAGLLANFARAFELTMNFYFGGIDWNDIRTEWSIWSFPHADNLSAWFKESDIEDQSSRWLNIFYLVRVINEVSHASVV